MLNVGAGADSYGLALDHPGRVQRLAVLEGIPIGEALARCNAALAALWYRWFFFGQTERPAERYISADPDAWYSATADWADDVRGEPIDCGHHMAEEAPEDLAARLGGFFAAPGQAERGRPGRRARRAGRMVGATAASANTGTYSTITVTVISDSKVAERNVEHTKS